jgi:hypothetical protein
MGAHTNSMIAGIRTALASLKVARDKVQKFKVPLAQAIAVRDQANAAVEKYYNAKGWQGQKPTREQEMDTDQVYAGLVAKWDEAWVVVNERAKDVKICTDAATVFSKRAMKMVQELEGYVKKKEAEKFWWQKKSVTAAKQFIDYAKAVI